MTESEAGREAGDADDWSNMNDYARRLTLGDHLRGHLIGRVIDTLRLPRGSHGLDAACGIGSLAWPLAEAIGDEGTITGLDLSSELLAVARETARKSGLAERVSFRKGNIKRLPFEDDSFDWIWSSDCAGYPAGGSPSLLTEFARVVRPGGTVAILAWSHQQLLPGYPLLEARLNATCWGIAPFTRGKKPESHFMRALSWFRAAGLQKTTARTFAGDIQAPLSAGVRAALVSQFEMCWTGKRRDLAPGDWEEYQRLCLPDSPDFIGDQPDYYAFFTYTLFCGQVPADQGLVKGQPQDSGR